MSERYQRPGWFTNHVFNPIVAGLTRAGISVGSQLTWVAVGAMAQAAEAMRDRGDLSSLNASVRIKEWLGS